MIRAYSISIVYFLTVLVFVTLAFFQRSEFLSISLKEVYFVLPKTIVWLALAFFFFLFAGIALTFELSGKPMNKYLFGTHFSLTILSLIVIYFGSQQQIAPPNYTDQNIADELQNQPEATFNWIQWTVYAVYVLLSAQIIFGLNILLSILRDRKAKKAQPQQ